MYVTMHVYRARRGEEDAIVALHEDWQRHLRARAGGFLSGKLLQDSQDSRRFVAIARYESAAAAAAAGRDAEYIVWQRRLESLTEEKPLCTSYDQVWRSGPESGPRQDDASGGPRAAVTWQKGGAGQHLGGQGCSGVQPYSSGRRLSMRRHILFLVISSLLILTILVGSGQTLAQGPAGGAPQAGLGPAFTYQGQLKDSAGNPITKTCDFRFGLWDALSGGARWAATAPSPGSR